ncbi:hypothetical protein AVEN_202326-1 [Araneus ventricosus]|uniref:Secreted protein n=1 Tax=Araneus ventricosus TaxID=182803 RepID=A0A4Y2E5C1_ARAVE|nr:hypothetical protein AVEN_202326-1 [Araneus ventricosus]
MNITFLGLLHIVHLHFTHIRYCLSQSPRLSYYPNPNRYATQIVRIPQLCGTTLTTFNKRESLIPAYPQVRTSSLGCPLSHDYPRSGGERNETDATKAQQATLVSFQTLAHLLKSSAGPDPCHSAS